MAKQLYMVDLGSSMLPMLGKFQSWLGSFLHKHMAVQLVIFLAVDEKKTHNNNKKMQPPLANFLEGVFGEHMEEAGCHNSYYSTRFFYQYVILFCTTGSRKTT